MNHKASGDISGAFHLHSHYFAYDENLPSRPRAFQYNYGARNYVFTTDNGVFSIGRMDPYSEILIKNIPPLAGSLLDLGCGFGGVGIVLAAEYPVTLTQSDINPRAVQLTKENAAQNGVASQVILSDGFDNIPGLFDAIVLNPPIHAGKETVYMLFEGAFKHLKPGGCFYTVIQKKHGAESAAHKLQNIFGRAETIYKKKECYIIKAEN